MAPIQLDLIPFDRDLPVCAQLQQALVYGGLEAHYQPVVAMHSGLVVGFEALVRWRHPTRGLLNASQFIPEAEACGLVRDLDDWMLQAVCRQLAEWQEDVLVAPGFRVAINMSGQEFVGDDLWRRLEEVLEMTGADPRCLGIELTETHKLGDLGDACRNIERLRAAGVEMSLDDFGTAYATFDQLRLLPFDVLKVDRDITSSANTPIGAAFIHAAVDLARSLDMTIVAEGIETFEQAQLLRSLGCRRGQGFHWSRALSAQASTRLLELGRLEGLSVR
jgi:EAL domain-containing protein (putative c-di-GMP-specific phosphodiesterase class I)